MKHLYAAAIVSLALCGSASASTVFSDDFDSYGGQLGATALGSKWTVTNGGTVDVIPVGTDFDWYSPEGGTGYVDLNGTPDSAATLTSSSFATVVGREYTVAFDYGKNKFSGGDKNFEFGLVGGAVNSLLLSGTIPDLVGAFFTFVATNTLSQIFFADATQGPSDSGGPILDNVSVSAVPLPAGALLLGGALAGFAAFGARRNRKSAA